MTLVPRYKPLVLEDDYGKDPVALVRAAYVHEVDRFGEITDYRQYLNAVAMTCALNPNGTPISEQDIHELPQDILVRIDDFVSELSFPKRKPIVG